MASRGPKSRQNTSLMSSFDNSVDTLNVSNMSMSGF
jgi:hypothetical protein